MCLLSAAGIWPLRCCLLRHLPSSNTSNDMWGLFELSVTASVAVRERGQRESVCVCVCVLEARHSACVASHIPSAMETRPLGRPSMKPPQVFMLSRSAPTAMHAVQRHAWCCFGSASEWDCESCLQH
jgi:hypothetical protein